MNKNWLVSALFALLLPAAAGCKQGIGDRCQRNSDCASGICSEAVPQVCVAAGSGTETEQIDAFLPADASDASLPDAATDAATDAAPPDSPP